jgi:hypothetical protein
MIPSLISKHINRKIVSYHCKENYPKIIRNNNRNKLGNKKVEMQLK